MGGHARVEERIEGRTGRAEVGPGQFSLTPAGMPVSRHWLGHPDVLLILVSPALVAAVARELDADSARIGLVPRLGAPDADLERLGRLLLSEAVTPQHGNTLVVNALSRALVVHLLRRHSNLGRLAAPGRGRLPPRRLARVVDFMRTHLDQPLTVGGLAAIGGLSTSHFTRAFREALGRPSQAYLIELRLEKARELLRHTRSSVTQIALSCGFEQSQHFATLFRRKLGTSPSEWRRQHEL